MIEIVSLAAAALAFGAGVALGWWWAGRRARAQRTQADERALEAARTMKEDHLRQAAALAAARAETAALRASMKQQVEAAGAAQRQEVARLEMHLVGALDEIERLRQQVATTRGPAPDTVPDYPATQPMPYRP